MFNIHDISFTTGDGVIYAIYDGSYYKINATVRLIITRLQKGEPAEQIAADLDLPKTDIDKLLATFSIKKKRYIHRLFTIVPKSVCNLVGRMLHPLFANQHLIAFVIIVFVGLQIWHCCTVPMLFYSPAIPSFYYGLIPLLIILWHEFGHISAAYQQSIKDMRVEVGTFLIFPTLYVNMNPIQRLTSRQWVMVDFGGFYFQMILGIGLMAYYHLSPSEFANITIYGNLIGILYNLIPYRISDGHWLYSDFFGIDNLNTQVGRIWKTLFALHLPRFKEIRLPIRLYFVWNSLFMGFLYYEMVAILLSNAYQIVPVYNQFRQQPLNLSMFYEGLMLILPYFLLLYVLYQITYGWFKKR